MPEACGAGVWGALDADADVIHVDTTASGTPDGTAESPFPAIDGGDEGEDPAIRVDRTGSRSPDVVLADLTVRGGFLGLQLGAGVVQGSGLRLLDNRLVGLYAYGGSTVTMSALGITGARADARTAGRGVEVEGATVTVQGCVVADSEETGIFVNGSTSVVTLRECAVMAGDGDGARGADVGGQGTLEVYDSEFTGNADFGVFAEGEGTTVHLVDTLVEATRPNADGAYGRGLNIVDGADLWVEGGEIAENTEVALYVAGAGSFASLDGTLVRDTQPGPSGYYGRGVSAVAEGRIELTDVTLVGNHESSVDASDPGSEVVMTGGTIQSTLANTALRFEGLYFGEALTEE